MVRRPPNRALDSTVRRGCGLSSKRHAGRGSPRALGRRDERVKSRNVAMNILTVNLLFSTLIF